MKLARCDIMEIWMMMSWIVGIHWANETMQYSWPTHNLFDFHIADAIQPLPVVC